METGTKSGTENTWSKYLHNPTSDNFTYMYIYFIFNAPSIYLEFSVLKVLNKLFDGGCIQISAFWLVFGHVFCEGDQTDSWTLLLFESEEFQDPGVILVAGIQVDEKNLKDPTEWIETKRCYHICPSSA